MKRIGDIAARLVAHPELMRAALNEPARELRVSRAPSTAANEGGRLTGEETISPPTLYADAPAPSGSNGKGRGTKPRQVQSQERDARLGDMSRGNSPALVLVIDNGWRSVHRRPYGVPPTPALRRPLLILIDGGRHAAAFGSEIERARRGR